VVQSAGLLFAELVSLTGIHQSKHILSLIVSTSITLAVTAILHNVSYRLITVFSATKLIIQSILKFQPSTAAIRLTLSIIAEAEVTDTGSLLKSLDEILWKSMK